MASGVAVHPDVKKEFEALKMNKVYRYIILGMSTDLKEIIVKGTKDLSGTYEDLVAELQKARENGECRYAIIDMPYSKGGLDKSKIVMFFWSPDDAKMKQKMLYAASKDALVRDLGSGIAQKVQANDDDDLCKDDIVAKLQKDDRFE